MAGLIQARLAWHVFIYDLQFSLTQPPLLPYNPLPVWLDHQLLPLRTEQNIADVDIEVCQSSCGFC